MSAAITLLMLAFQLLTAVANTPNAPQSLRESATTVANMAITEANKQLGAQNIQPVITSAPVIPVSAPQYIYTPAPVVPAPGGILTVSMPVDQSAITAEVINRSKPDAGNDSPYGEYQIQVRVLNASGVTVKGTPIAMDAPNNLYSNPDSRTLDTVASKETGNDFYHVFVYNPTKAGPATLTFTSGNLTQLLTLNVD